MIVADKYGLDVVGRWVRFHYLDFSIKRTCILVDKLLKVVSFNQAQKSAGGLKQYAFSDSNDQLSVGYIQTVTSDWLLERQSIIPALG
jgi:hypothetical protein